MTQANVAYRNVSEALRGTKQTNQRAELTAILRALDIAPRHRDVTIYTDSKYAISCVTEWYKNWVKNKWTNSKGKPVENKDLIVDIREKIEERDYLQKGTFFVWVKGHAADEGNVAADRLAVEGARRGRGVTEDTERQEELERTEDAEESVGDSEMASGEEDPEVVEAFRAMDEAMGESEGESEGEDEDGIE
jgi:ribonuclease HI